LFGGVRMPLVGAKRTILVCYGLVFALACLWVPWNIRRPSGATERFEHGFLWSPPQGYRTLPAPPDLAVHPEQETRGWAKAFDEYERTSLAINWGELSLEILALTALCGAALLAIARKANPN